MSRVNQIGSIAAQNYVRFSGLLSFRAPLSYIDVEVSGPGTMADGEPNGIEDPVERHIRRILAQIGALKQRLRAQARHAPSEPGEDPKYA